MGTSIHGEVITGSISKAQGKRLIATFSISDEGKLEGFEKVS